MGLTVSLGVQYLDNVDDGTPAPHGQTLAKTSPLGPKDISSSIHNDDQPDAVQPRAGWATGREWEVYRHTIIRLYRDENQTLRDVKEIMQTSHGFYATYVMSPRPPKPGIPNRGQGEDVQGPP